jgi:hypothetical protein
MRPATSRSGEALIAASLKVSPRGCAEAGARCDGINSHTVGDEQTFQSDLSALGFRAVQDRGTGIVQFALQATPFLTYWVHWNVNDHSVLFTWEHAIGEYVSGIGFQIGANEELNQFMFPKYDARGPADIAFVVQEMDRAEQLLRTVDFLQE